MSRKVLVVDDEKLIVKGIRFSLEQDGMEVDCAYDGEEAVEKAKDKKYDIILLDLMLPKMDGLEVCQQIREFSNVPIVMLTAKGEDMDKILGLEYGADDYITKPFNPEILKTKIKNVLKSRELISRRYATLSALEPEEFVTEDKDATFLLEIIEFIKANVSNPDLKVDDLSKNAGMSRSPFFKKLKNLTGKTPNDFIRDIRLNQAAKLLLKSDLNITEIAYQTGFTSPKYFRECFKKQFGESPSQYIENKKSLPGK